MNTAGPLPAPVDGREAPCARFLSVDLLGPCVFPFSVVVFVIPVARGPYRPEAVGLLGDPFRGRTVGMNPGARVLPIGAPRLLCTRADEGRCRVGRRCGIESATGRQANGVQRQRRLTGPAAINRPPVQPGKRSWWRQAFEKGSERRTSARSLRPPGRPPSHRVDEGPRGRDHALRRRASSSTQVKPTGA